MLLFHELQGQVGGFLGNRLYLLHSSAIVGIATVSVHARQLHAVRASDGQSKFEGSCVWIQDSSYNRASTGWASVREGGPWPPWALPLPLPQSSFIQTCHRRPSLSGLFLSCSRASGWSNKTWKRSSLSDRAAQSSTYGQRQKWPSYSTWLIFGFANVSSDLVIYTICLFSVWVEWAGPYQREESKRRGCHQNHGRRRNWLQQVWKPRCVSGFHLSLYQHTPYNHTNLSHKMTAFVSTCIVCVCVPTGFCGFSCGVEVGRPASGVAQPSSGHFSSLCQDPPPEQGYTGMRGPRPSLWQNWNTHQIFLIQLNCYAWLVSI